MFGCFFFPRSFPRDRVKLPLVFFYVQVFSLHGVFLCEVREVLRRLRGGSFFAPPSCYSLVWTFFSGRRRVLGQSPGIGVRLIPPRNFDPNLRSQEFLAEAICEA